MGSLLVPGDIPYTNLSENDDNFAEQVENFLRFTGAEPLEPNARIIAVIGMTGSGKSRFIARCSGKIVKIGHGLQSTTTSLCIIKFQHRGSAIYLIDTPGFDDTNRPDTEILKIIGHYLGVSYANGVFLDGLIYLHRISDNRMTGTARQNINMFRELCGKENFPRVLIATTMWKEDEMEDGLRREQELLEEPSYFGNLVDGGARLLRHGPFGDSLEEERVSALDIVSHLLKQARSRDDHLGLQIQRELIDEMKSLDDTSAGKVLSVQVQEAKEQFRKDLQDLQAQWRDQLQQKETEVAQNYEEIERDLELKIAQKEEKGRALMTNLVQMHREEENRVLKQIDEASDQWRLQISRREAALMETERTRHNLQDVCQQHDTPTVEPQNEVNVESESPDLVRQLRQEVAQLRKEHKLREEKAEQVRKAIKFKKAGSEIFTAGKYLHVLSTSGPTPQASHVKD